MTVWQFTKMLIDLLSSSFVGQTKSYILSNRLYLSLSFSIISSLSLSLSLSLSNRLYLSLSLTHILSLYRSLLSSVLPGDDTVCEKRRMLRQLIFFSLNTIVKLFFNFWHTTRNNSFLPTSVLSWTTAFFSKHAHNTHIPTDML